MSSMASRTASRSMLSNAAIRALICARCAARRIRSARCSGVGRGSCQPAGNGTDDFSRSAQI